eukprot:TRINITY_DN2973_c0_g1_i2.p1 TRINITY_DN2973_c0_g1~~TRINITY_DN2973_c0_g1_i2.p1  ORF type:complete len:424 (-),score=69.55 TRINITY_DN2973_c0_g1_i2:12-1283(-)
MDQSATFGAGPCPSKRNSVDVSNLLFQIEDFDVVSENEDNENDEIIVAPLAPPLPEQDCATAPIRGRKNSLKAQGAVDSWMRQSWRFSSDGGQLGWAWNQKDDSVLETQDEQDESTHKEFDLSEAASGYETPSVEAAQEWQWSDQNVLPLISQAPLKVGISETYVSEDNKRTHTVYRIAVSQSTGDEADWFIDHRYSDFVTLEHLVKKEYPSFEWKVKRPPKKLIDSLNPTLVKERQIGLERLLRHLLTTLPESRVLTSFLTDNMILPDSLKTVMELNKYGNPSGYLRKKGRKSNVFVTRWFYVTNKYMMYYRYRGAIQSKGKYPLLLSKVQPLRDDDECSFEIIFDGNAHVLSCENPIQRDKWVAAIFNAIENAKEKSGFSRYIRAEEDNLSLKIRNERLEARVRELEKQVKTLTAELEKRS